MSASRHQRAAEGRVISVGQFVGQLGVALTQIGNGDRDGFPALQPLKGNEHNEFCDLVIEMLAGYDGWTIRRDDFIKKTLRLYDDDFEQIRGEHPEGAMDPEA